ncbi:MAG: aminotransferase class I/II-fold pyridoxal phosphate-dependent enzyme [Trueperaceae bacterium]|nr:MAG: aminotransferase class I/II-fold pyridoxal phosphate-dependent enzyme [Trueperaceae bacterium]
MRDVVSARARAIEISPQTSLATTDLINLASGTPDFEVPTFVLDAMIDSLRERRLQYTAWSGMPALRRAIAGKLARENALEVDADTEVLVTAGAQEALMTVLMTLLDPGDEVIITDPHYGVYTRAVTIAGGSMVRVPTTRASGFVPDPAAIEAAVTDKTKAVIVVSPSNPTGAVFPRDVLEGIVRVARERDLVVISDEIYEHYVFDDAVHTSIATLPGARERTVTINSLSKGYALTGVRLGYVVAPEPLIRAMLPFHHGMTICAPITAQYGAVAAFEADRNWFVPILAEYDRRRRAWMQALDEVDVPYARPRGAYYVAVDVSDSGLDLPTFVRRARDEAGLQLGVGGAGCLRGSLMQASPRLEEGLERFQTFVRSLR